MSRLPSLRKQRPREQTLTYKELPRRETESDPHAGRKALRSPPSNELDRTGLKKVNQRLSGIVIRIARNVARL